MYYWFFRCFPKSALSRLAGWAADVRWPAPLLHGFIRLYIRAFGIDMTQFAQPVQAHATFTSFFTREVRAGSRPLPADPQALACPVDGRVIESGTVRAGRLLQAKGRDFSLAELLGGDPEWRRFEAGAFVSLYLHPRDYHRIHAPCAGAVTGFRYVPGELWSVSPPSVNGVPNLFARNERLVTEMATGCGPLALVAVGATIVGRIKVVYHGVISHRRGARPAAMTLPVPYRLERGAELGRFELGSTVILLLPPDARLNALPAGMPVRMGMEIGRMGGAPAIVG